MWSLVIVEIEPAGEGVAAFVAASVDGAEAQPLSRVRMKRSAFPFVRGR